MSTPFVILFALAVGAFGVIVQLVAERMLVTYRQRAVRKELEQIDQERQDGLRRYVP